MGSVYAMVRIELNSLVQVSGNAERDSEEIDLLCSLRRGHCFQEVLSGRVERSPSGDQGQEAEFQSIMKINQDFKSQFQRKVGTR